MTRDDSAAVDVHVCVMEYEHAPMQWRCECGARTDAERFKAVKINGPVEYPQQPQEVRDRPRWAPDRWHDWP